MHDICRPKAPNMEQTNFPTQQTGQVMGDLTAVAVLEPEQHGPGPTGERDSRDHVTAERHRRRRGECEAARTTHHRPDTVTPCTTRLEHHAPQHDEGVSQGFAASATLCRTRRGGDLSSGSSRA